ncbi:MAG: HEPN domain-containing protein [Pseudomonadota bacterium]|nr:HEPN domain-containing protein [Pseudomonadota bacterium]
MTPALEEALKLLRLAQADRDTLVYLIPAVHLRDASVLFHAQQAIEKAFKAVMTAKNVPFGRSHNLLALAAALLEHGEDTPYPPDEVAALNPYAVLFRYDDEDIALVSRIEAEEMVMNVLSWAENVLEIRP